LYVGEIAYCLINEGLIREDGVINWEKNNNLLKNE